MNEKIKDLAKQAGYQEDIFGIGHWDMPECEKFAELIVRECCDIALSHRSCEGIADRIVADIKQHCGVE